MRVRESCICGGNKVNVAVALPPFDVEIFSHGAMDFRFGRAVGEHPGDESAPLVNLCPRAFDVWATLAGADHWCFGCFHVLSR